MVYPAQVNAQTQMLLRFFSPWDYKDFDCTPEPKVGDARQFKSLEMTFSFEKEFKWVLFIPTVTLPGLLFSTPITLPFPPLCSLEPPFPPRSLTPSALARSRMEIPFPTIEPGTDQQTALLISASLAELKYAPPLLHGIG